MNKNIYGVILLLCIVYEQIPEEWKPDHQHPEKESIQDQPRKYHGEDYDTMEDDVVQNTSNHRGSKNHKRHKPKPECVIFTFVFLLGASLCVVAACIKCRRRRRCRQFRQQVQAQESLMNTTFPRAQNLPLQGIPVMNQNQQQPQFFAVPAAQYHLFQQFLQNMQQQQFQHHQEQPQPMQYQQGQPPQQCILLSSPNIPVQKGRYPVLQETDGRN